MHTIKHRPLFIFFRVISALFLMEVQVRFGSKRMGYIWAIIDPMTKVVIFAVMKMFIMAGIHGLDFPVFLAINFFWYEFFRRVVMSSMGIFKANKALYNFKRVRPIDTLFAMIAVEFFVSLVSLIVFLGILRFIGMDISIKDFNMVFVAVLWLSVFTFAFALFSAVVNAFYKNFQKFITFLFTPLMFSSALFYAMDLIPERFSTAKTYLLYNPLVHFMEMIHGNYFRVLDTSYVDYNYMLLWTIIPLFLGLFLYKYSEKKIIGL